MLLVDFNFSGWATVFSDIYVQVNLLCTEKGQCKNLKKDNKFLRIKINIKLIEEAAKTGNVVQIEKERESEISKKTSGKLLSLSHTKSP